MLLQHPISAFTPEDVNHQISKECIIQDKLSTAATVNCFNLYTLEALTAATETPVDIFLRNTHPLSFSY